MTNAQIPTVELNDGTEMPLVGMGTYKLHGDELKAAVRAAIEAGYRHIDTASFYGNEEDLGAAINDAIAAGDVEREELFIATKAWNDEQGAENIPQAFRRSLKRLGLDYLDLYLLHWPWPQNGTYNESFEAMARIQGLGDVQSIGVCNFYEEVLEDLVSKTGVTPAVNQVEMHVGFTQPKLRALHDKLGIVSQAWAPLGRGVPLNDPDIKAIGARHDASSAQVVLSYLLHLGVSVIPKSADAQRVVNNLGAAGVELDRKDLDVLDALEGRAEYGRLSNDPRTYPG